MVDSTGDLRVGHARTEWNDIDAFPTRPWSSFLCSDRHILGPARLMTLLGIDVEGIWWRRKVLPNATAVLIRDQYLLSHVSPSFHHLPPPRSSTIRFSSRSRTTRMTCSPQQVRDTVVVSGQNSVLPLARAQSTSCNRWLVCRSVRPLSIQMLMRFGKEEYALNPCPVHQTSIPY